MVTLTKMKYNGPWFYKNYTWFFCSQWEWGTALRFNNGNPYMSYELGWFRVFRYLKIRK